ncbi:type II toxin-antitoxin system YafQ family toxin [Kingella negevensis]|nr:type II toxin-antitoxin system YafQ family toxin [Kingella negevensis]MDK4680023.1 type II toxin-antitoxin system YafQ family toxin [Kingella negevensis]MDK4682257.1 type II toxin-antitoxin system YafQ family toxin [Kingella negevensis]MDK4684825.1 type II toxin-antitoxin system YafQ family toxin [Kingella negevensis]MDK4688278.1 type II toxin-antitoxin system YafQ family toxin [Kingella negevensis]MDK4690454.1 type II toxin-antitoxin system YafQ family toxin [Kingella negevensis]
MTRKLVPSKQFKRDVKNRLDLLLTSEWTTVSWSLINNQPMPEKFKDHELKGNLNNFRECHVKPDLLLLYTSDDDEVHLARLGSHSELFG